MTSKKKPAAKIATADEVKEMLELTPEKIEAYQEQHLKTYRSRAMLSREERKLGRAIELERHFRQTGKADGLAEALAAQGRFTEAVEASQSKELRAEFAAKADAMTAEPCECDTVGTDGDVNRYAESETFDERGNTILLIRCRQCRRLYRRSSQ